MTALAYACFGLCILSGAVGSQLRRLRPTSPLRLPVDGAFAVTLVALLSLVEGFERRSGMLGAVFAGATTVSCILMGCGERLVPIQRCIWFGVAALSAIGATLLLTFLQHA